MKGYAVKDGKPILTNLPEPKLKPHHVIVKNLFAGINHLDIESLQSSDFASNKKLLGFEGVGVVEEVDPSCVKKFQVGQKVCYSLSYGVGAFSQKASVHENFVIPIPIGIQEDHAATMFKALASHMLLFRTYTLRKGNVLGVTGSSGGVASYLTQWATSLGVKVIGLHHNLQHKAIAAENGCVASFSYKEVDKFIEQAKKLSSVGLGLNAFYDSVGINAYAAGIKALAPFGLYVNYGELSSAIKGMSAKHFQKKALFFTTPLTFYSKTNVADLSLTANMIFENFKNHTLRPNITRYKFQDLHKAFTEMKTGQTAGQKVLVIG